MTKRKKKRPPIVGVKSMQIRLPEYLAHELDELNHILKQRVGASKWSQNKIVCEALRVWIIGAKKQLGENDNANQNQEVARTTSN
jgi:hypothetical protein